MTKKSNAETQDHISSDEFKSLHRRSGLSFRQMARLFSWSDNSLYNAFARKGIASGGWRHKQYHSALKAVEKAERDVLAKLGDLPENKLAEETRSMLLAYGEEGSPFHILRRESLRHGDQKIKVSSWDLYKNAQGWWD